MLDISQTIAINIKYQIEKFVKQKGVKKIRISPKNTKNMNL